MLRRLVYLAAFLLVATVLLIAATLPETRLAFIGVAAAIVFAAWRLTRRLPARAVSARELQIAAVATVILGVAIAVLLPATTASCDCPPPANATLDFSCNCMVDQHTALRLGIVLAALTLSVVMAFASKRLKRGNEHAPSAMIEP
jgi:hypothetical protein